MRLNEDFFNNTNTDFEDNQHQPKNYNYEIILPVIRHILRKNEAKRMEYSLSGLPFVESVEVSARITDNHTDTFTIHMNAYPTTEKDVYNLLKDIVEIFVDPHTGISMGDFLPTIINDTEYTPLDLFRDYIKWAYFKWEEIFDMNMFHGAVYNLIEYTRDAFGIPTSHYRVIENFPKLGYDYVYDTVMKIYRELSDSTDEGLSIPKTYHDNSNLIADRNGFSELMNFHEPEEFSVYIDIRSIDNNNVKAYLKGCDSKIDNSVAKRAFNLIIRRKNLIPYWAVKSFKTTNAEPKDMWLCIVIVFGIVCGDFVDSNTTGEYSLVICGKHSVVYKWIHKLFNETNKLR